MDCDVLREIPCSHCPHCLRVEKICLNVFPDKLELQWEICDYGSYQKIDESFLNDKEREKLKVLLKMLSEKILNDKYGKPLTMIGIRNRIYTDKKLADEYLKKCFNWKPDYISDECPFKTEMFIWSIN